MASAHDIEELRALLAKGLPVAGKAAVWQGSPDPKCDHHRYVLRSSDPPDAVVDCKTAAGPWGCLCESCFRMFGVGLGVGRGQALIRPADQKPAGNPRDEE